MNFLKTLWLQLFQHKNATSVDFLTEPFSGEALLAFAQEAGFEELVTEDGSLRFRFDGQEVTLESDPEQLALQVSELLLEFDPPSFPDEGLELEEAEMQGLDEHFWEKYVFDEDFAKDIPNFAEPEFQPLPFDTLTLDEKEKELSNSPAE